MVYGARAHSVLLFKLTRQVFLNCKILYFCSDLPATKAICVKDLKDPFVRTTEQEIVLEGGVLGLLLANGLFAIHLTAAQ